MTQNLLQSNVNANTWITSFLGIGVVFFGLIVIIALLYLMRAFLSIKRKKEPTATTQENVNSQDPAQSLPIENRGELVAAICAAIAEDCGTDISAIRVISLKQIS